MRQKTIYDSTMERIEDFITTDNIDEVSNCIFELAYDLSCEEQERTLKILEENIENKDLLLTLIKEYRTKAAISKISGIIIYELLSKICSNDNESIELIKSILNKTIAQKAGE